MRNGVFKFTLLALAMVHLTMVTLSALYIRIPDWFMGKGIIDFYEKASGADSSYGFFAPAIGGKIRVVFDLIDKNGMKTENITLAPELGREAQIRLGGVYDEFVSEEAEDPNFRRPLAASLVASLFSKHQKASEVILRVQEMLPRTMDEYRLGQRGYWSEHYAARFVKETNPKKSAP